MQLPSEILTILEQLLNELHTSHVHANPQLIDRAESLLQKFKPNDSKIFQPGRFTDFEAMLFQKTLNQELKKEMGVLHTEIGMMQSEIHELEDRIVMLQSDLNEKEKTLNKSLNLKSGERERLLLDANFVILDKKVANYKDLNSKLNEKLKVKNREIAQLLHRIHGSSAA